MPQSRKHNQNAMPIKTTIAALFLSVFGVVFTFIGLVSFFRDGLGSATPFLVMGGIGLIPGVFNLSILVRAYLGHKGYRYDMVPSYDD